MREGSFSAGSQPPQRHPLGSGTQPAAADPGLVRRSARLRPCARRRHGDSHKTPAPGAPANGSARRGETRTSLFQDGGASVASGRAGGKPAKPSKAAARDRTEAAVAAVRGGPGSFRCCYGCCHAARLGRTSLPRGVMMLTEVSGAPCLPEAVERPALALHRRRSGRWARPGPVGLGSRRDPTSATEWARC
ncbi:sorting nexin-13 isoform X1 [Sigmodon hispidus]